MASKKTASKTSKKAEINISAPKLTKKQSKKVKSNIKNMSMKTLCIALCLFLIAGVAGLGVAKYLTRNDCFEIIGKDELTLSFDERYVDEGVKVVAFGVDCADKVKVETDLMQDDDGYYAEVEGTYYIKYTVDNIKYGTIFKVQKIRLITFVEPSEDDEFPVSQEVTNV